MHVRVDSGLYTGYRVPPYYDSMIGKLIVYGTTREGCITRLRRALEEFVVEGMKTTIPLHQKLVRDPEFLAGDYTIKWLEQWLETNREDAGLVRPDLSLTVAPLIVVPIAIVPPAVVVPIAAAIIVTADHPRLADAADWARTGRSGHGGIQCRSLAGHRPAPLQPSRSPTPCPKQSRFHDSFSFSSSVTNEIGNASFHEFEFMCARGTTRLPSVSWRSGQTGWPREPGRMSLIADLKSLEPSQRSAIWASYLGWTLDAFDFFLLVFMLSAIAKEFGTDVKAVSQALFLTLAARPIRRLRLRLAGRTLRSPPGADGRHHRSSRFLEFALRLRADALPSLLVLRSLFGFAMGGEWGLGASLVMESDPGEAARPRLGPAPERLSVGLFRRQPRLLSAVRSRSAGAACSWSASRPRFLVLLKPRPSFA